MQLVYLRQLFSSHAGSQSSAARAAMSMRKLTVLLLLLYSGESARAYSTGAPADACTTLTPNHRKPPQPSPSPYTLDLLIFDLYSDGYYYYEPGETYQCKLAT